MRGSRPAADAVVVLGAKVSASGRAGPAVHRRVAHAIRVLERRRIDVLLLSGGNAGPGPSEAEVMRRLVLEHGVSVKTIMIEDRSRNTFENAVYTGRVMMDHGWRRIVIVTDAWHMRRALYVFRRVFRRLGMDASGDPAPRPSEVSRLAWAWAHAGDCAALVRSAWLFRIGKDRHIVEFVLKSAKTLKA